MVVGAVVVDVGADVVVGSDDVVGGDVVGLKAPPAVPAETGGGDAAVLVDAPQAQVRTANSETHAAAAGRTVASRWPVSRLAGQRRRPRC